MMMNGIIRKAKEKIYPLVAGKESISVKDYVDILKQLPKDEISNNFTEKFKAFKTILSENDTLGYETLQLFTIYKHAGFFGENLSSAFIGKIDNDGNYKAMVLLKNDISQKTYIFDPDSLDLTEYDKKLVEEMFDNGDLFYSDISREKIL